MIIELSAQNRTPKDIASIVDCDVTYVWKERSVAKKKGMLAGGRTEFSRTRSIAYTQAGTKLTESQKIKSVPGIHLAVPLLDAEAVKNVYAEFLNRKKPADVIAQYGYHPAAVEEEYDRFLILQELGPEILIKAIVDKVASYDGLWTRDRVEKFHRDGILTIEDLVRLVSEQYLDGQTSVRDDMPGLLNDTNRPLPEGLTRLYCRRCGQAYPGIGIVKGSRIDRSLKAVVLFSCQNCDRG